MPGTTPDLPHDREPGMDAQTHRQLYSALLLQARIELADGLHHPQSGPHGPLGILFVGERVAQIGQQATTEILRDMPLEAGDHLGAGVLIGPHYGAEVFRIELAGEGSRVYQITEQHSELAAFSVKRLRFDWRGRHLRGRGFPGGRRWCGWR